jgi:hypothetical protein
MSDPVDTSVAKSMLTMFGAHAPAAIRRDCRLGAAVGPAGAMDKWLQVASIAEDLIRREPWLCFPRPKTRLQDVD